MHADHKKRETNEVFEVLMIFYDIHIELFVHANNMCNNFN